MALGQMSDIQLDVIFIHLDERIGLICNQLIDDKGKTHTFTLFK